MAKAAAFEFLEYAEPAVAGLTAAYDISSKVYAQQRSKYSNGSNKPMKWKRPSSGKIRVVPPSASKVTGKGSSGVKSVSESASSKRKAENFEGDNALTSLGGSDWLHPGGKKLRVTVGPRVSNNNMDFLRQLVNQQTTVSTEFAYRYVASTDMRAFHFQHYRHNLHSRSSSAGKYTYVQANYANVLKPVAHLENANPTRLTPYALVASGNENTDQYAMTGNVLGADSQYSPWNKADLENMSYRLQNGRHLVDYRQKGDGGYTNTNVYYNEEDYPEVSKTNSPDMFSALSLIHKVNDARSRMQQDNWSGLVDTGAMFKNHKAHLIGGKVDYAFTNTSGNPAKVTIVVYKVKKGFQGTPTNTSDSAEDPHWDGSKLQHRHVELTFAGYRDKQARRLGLKRWPEDLQIKNNNINAHGGGRQPRMSDIAADPRFKFLPEYKSAVPSEQPYIEQQRVTFELPAGTDREICIGLPGRLYNPNSEYDGKIREQSAGVTSTTSDVQLMSDAAAAHSKVTMHDRGQYSIAIGVSGCEGVGEYTATLPALGTLREGTAFGTTEVCCKGRYTERIGAMSIALPMGSSFTNGHLADIVSANSTKAAIAILPASTTILTQDAANPVINLSDDLKAEPMAEGH